MTKHILGICELFSTNLYFLVIWTQTDQVGFELRERGFSVSPGPVNYFWDFQLRKFGEFKSMIGMIVLGLFKW